MDPHKPILLALTALSKYLDHRIDPETLRVWAVDLGRQCHARMNGDPRPVLEAITRLRLKTSWMPRPAEIMAEMGMDGPGNALAAWYALRVPRKGCAYNPDALHDPWTAWCWQKLGGSRFGSWDIRAEDRHRDQFITLYQHARRVYPDPEDRAFRRQIPDSDAIAYLHLLKNPPSPAPVDPEDQVMPEEVRKFLADLREKEEARKRL